jgi:uncharacterized protein DUF3987/DNA primase RepB-like protein
MGVTEQDEQTALLLQFFEYLFGNDEGFFSIATTRPPAKRDTFGEQFFAWPKAKHELVAYIDRVAPSYNVYFGVNLLSVPRRIKENAVPQNLVWADLETCTPDKLDIPPQCVIESSPNRYQAIWRLDEKIAPAIAENFSKRIAYQYADLGVDKSGHDLTQLLRVPGTFNFKYQLADAPQVRLVSMLEDLLPVEVFEALPPPEIPDSALPDKPVPGDDDTTPEMILYRYQDALRQSQLSHTFAKYYSEEPAQDWSKSLWRLLSMCFEVGMSAEETFVIAKHSKCNKFARDGRPDSHLWRDVLKAEIEHGISLTLLTTHRFLNMPVLLTAKEEDAIETTIIDDYKAWATETTDAVPIFHEIGCTVLLSALMSTTLRLDISNKKIVPNLWAILLGDSTLTRKTTAMDMAVDFVLEVNRDLILGSDASAEGLLSALSLRPKQVSIFHRDEVTGFFDAIGRKEYLASLPEVMTKLYDVPKYMARILKKDTYVVAEPIFIFFGGGVPEKFYTLIEEEYITSGFLPRFLIVRGFADSDKVKPIGPPGNVDQSKRFDLLQTFMALHSTYTDQEVTIEAPDGSRMTTTPEIDVQFTRAMWDRAAQMEQQLLKAASASHEAAKALPSFSRLFVSMLKLTMLFAAARQEPVDRQVRAEMGDLLSAAKYIQEWGHHTADLVLNSGLSASEGQTRAVYRTIEAHPGVLRGHIMQRHKLSARDATMIEETLVQRGLIQSTPRGRGKQYWPLGK